MAGSCGCGTEVRYAFHHLGCIECGAPCCPSCAVSLESVSYCRACAGSLLGSADHHAGVAGDR
jgi:hypothetical protein